MKILITLLIVLGLMINPAFAKVHVGKTGRAGKINSRVYHSIKLIKSRANYGIEKVNLGTAI